jgi:hypothetical protein
MMLDSHVCHPAGKTSPSGPMQIDRCVCADVLWPKFGLRIFVGANTMGQSERPHPQESGLNRFVSLWGRKSSLLRMPGDRYGTINDTLWLQQQLQD